MGAASCACEPANENAQMDVGAMEVYGQLHSTSKRGDDRWTYELDDIKNITFKLLRDNVTIATDSIKSYTEGEGMSDLVDTLPADEPRLIVHFFRAIWIGLTRWTRWSSLIGCRHTAMPP
eukprot:TRINITY_DN11088_c0_g1_i1.p1 TRINITY_DN11088_c0_g1~~TRINITY_DN11088_c0_g1_i1.p1  ORF type:complete len:120 (+),score=13.44 TRINITY_DN11088_c0_g1_i1:54-413(+)